MGAAELVGFYIPQFVSPVGLQSPSGQSACCGGRQLISLDGESHVEDHAMRKHDQHDHSNGHRFRTCSH